MTNQTSPCDLKTIESFLSDQLDVLERENFSTHLETCESCRNELDRKAAEPEFWTEAADLLSTTFDSASLFDASEKEAVDPGSNLSLRTIIDWLSPTDNPEMLGRIGEFEISGIVGVGGMGSVLKGFDPSLHRVVAIKVMAPHLANNGSARTRFEREARAAAAITHPNVIDIFRVDEKDGLPYLVMPFARGPSLQKRIDSDGPLSTLEVIQTGRQIASGLAAAHEQGLVHRDIKPANILLSDGLERLLITDFGVARAMDDASMTQTGLIAGTPQYMSPEQARGEWVDHRSDQFSLGAVLYTACTGRPPFRAEAPFAVLRKVTDSDPRPIREINPEIPDWLESLIHRLLSKDPADRFEDAEEVAHLFEKCLAHLRQPTQIELPQTVVDIKPAIIVKPKPLPTKSKFFSFRTGVVVSLIALFSVSLAALAAYFSDAPDIGGIWQGELWKKVELSSVEEAQNWYAGNFVDAEGNRGAIHLEWSPLSRRFDGRWSIGTEKSGTIVLRPGAGGSVRGAILMDSSAQYASDHMRLRDFSWKKGEAAITSFSAGEGSIVPGNGATVASSQGTNVFSPVTGVVREVSPGIRNGESVSKGQVILKIQSELEEQQLSALNVQREVASVKVEAAQNDVQAFAAAAEYSVQAAKESADAAKAKYQSKVALTKSYEAKVEQAQSVYEHSEKLHAKSYVSDSQLEKDKRELEMAKAQLKAFKYEVEVLKKEWEADMSTAKEAQATSKSKVDAAKQNLANAEGELKKTESKIKFLEVKVAQGIVAAPVDGFVSQWRDLQPGETVRIGDLILNVRPTLEASIDSTSKSLRIAAPSSGIIAKLSDRVGNGKFLRKGDLIAEIDSGHSEEFEDRIEEAKSRLLILNANVKSKERSIENAKEANAYAIEGAKQLADAAESRFKSKQKSLAGLDAIAQQALANFERQKKLHKSNLQSEKALDTARKDSEVARSGFESAKYEAETLNKEWKALQLGVKEKQVLLKMNVDDAQSDLEVALAQLQQIESEISRLQMKAQRAKRVSVFAPVDGIIEKSGTLTVGQRVREREELLRLDPEEETKNEAEKPDSKEHSKSISELTFFDYSSLRTWHEKCAEVEDRVQVRKELVKKLGSELNKLESKSNALSEVLQEMQDLSSDQSKTKLNRQEARNVRRTKVELARVKVARKQLEQKIQDRENEIRDAKNELEKTIEPAKIQLAAAKAKLTEISKAIDRETAKNETGDKAVLKKLELARRQLESVVVQYETLFRLIRQITEN